MNCTPVSLQYVISPVFFMALGHYVLRLFLLSLLEDIMSRSHLWSRRPEVETSGPGD